MGPHRRPIAAPIVALLLSAGAAAALAGAEDHASAAPAPAARPLRSQPPAEPEDAAERLSRIERATWDRDAKSIPLLREWAETDPSDRVRERSVGALAIVRDPGAASVFLSRLRDDPSAAVRRAAAEAVGLLRLAAAAVPLADSLKNDSDPYVRAECARAIGRIGAASSRHALLVALFWDPSPEVRALAAEAIAAVRSPDGAEMLQAVAERDESLLVRTYVVRALARAYPRSSGPLLGKIWEEARDPELRLEAFRGLLLADGGQAWERIGLADGDERVRFAAFHAWLTRTAAAWDRSGQFPDAFVATLEPFLADRVRGIRELARRQIESLGFRVRPSGFGYAVER